MAVLTHLASRALPGTVQYVKRAVSVQAGDGEKIEIPTWGIVLLYVSFFVGAMFVSLVRPLVAVPSL